MRVSPRNAVRIEEIPGERWSLALDGLRSGASACYFDGDVTVRLSRWNQGPRDDGRIHVEIFATQEYPVLTKQVAETDVRGGLALFERVLAAGPKLSDLLSDFGVSYDYIWDYGNGAVAIAEIVDQARLVWFDEHGPPN